MLEPLSPTRNFHCWLNSCSQADSPFDSPCRQMHSRPFIFHLWPSWVEAHPLSSLEIQRPETANVKPHFFVCLLFYFFPCLFSHCALHLIKVFRRPLRSILTRDNRFCCNIPRASIRSTVTCNCARKWTFYWMLRLRSFRANKNSVQLNAW